MILIQLYCRIVYIKYNVNILNAHFWVRINLYVHVFTSTMYLPVTPTNSLVTILNPLYIFNPRQPLSCILHYKKMCSFPVFHKNENTQYELVWARLLLHNISEIHGFFWVSGFFYSWVVVYIIWIIQAFV